MRRGLLRYFGGKWVLSPWIIGHFPAHRCYTDAFGGGGSVLMRKPRAQEEVYNDLDDEIVNVFRVLRDQGDEACAGASRSTVYARAEWKLAQELPWADNVERARRTVARAMMGLGSNVICQMNTGFRTADRNGGSHPASDWRTLPDAMPEFIERFRGVCIENRDALYVIDHYDTPQTLHYVDPPYVHSSRRWKAARGYKHEMAYERHRVLAEVLNRVAGMVLLSGYPSTLYDEVYAGWERHEHKGTTEKGLAST